jgi:hypothetical protein
MSQSDVLSKNQILQWLKLLRSGELKQIKGRLGAQGYYCAVGVLAKRVLDKPKCGYHFDKINNTLGNEFSAHIITLNDRERKSFKQIAVSIERRAKKLGLI